MTEFSAGSVLVAGLLWTACAPPQPPQLQWSSALGGASVDDCDDIVVDGAKFIFLACHSDSNDFPASQRAGSDVNGGMDAYVVKVDASAGRIVWTARMGGSNYDGAFRIHSDGAGGVWVVGYTGSRDFPATATAVQRRFGGGDGDGFLARVDANGDLRYSSYLGGTGSDQLIDLVSDRQDGSVHVIGMTSSTDLPRARNFNLGKEEAFLASFDPTRPEGLRVQYLDRCRGPRRSERRWADAQREDERAWARSWITSGGGVQPARWPTHSSLLIGVRQIRAMTCGRQ